MPIPLIVAGILIAKGFTLLGPEGEVTEEKLDGYLASVNAANTDGLVEWLQDEVDTTVRLLVAAHTAVVMMQASIREFELKPGFTKKTITVAAFDPDEVGRNAQPGEIQKSKYAIAGVLKNTRGRRLGSILFQKVKQADGQSAPVLQQYLKKLAALPDPDEFELQSCLDTCRGAAKYAGVREQYFLAALPLIRSVLGEADLNQALGWLNDATNPSEEALAWLEGRLDTDALHKQVTACYDSNNPGPDETKMTLSRIAVMLETNAGFYNRIYERIEWLEDAIAEFPRSLADEQKALTKLVQAMCGAIAWRIFRQARFAAWEARTALGTLGLDD